ncbi:MAG: sialidase family protein [Pseudonocardiales bacterium]
MFRNRFIALAVAVALAALLPTTAAAASAPHQLRAPVVLHVGQIDRQDIPPLPGSEPDTLVEPDVAVSPVNPLVAVAAAHDGRYPDGGAVDISYAWTHDGGQTWHHAPLPGITKSAGGTWDRASDPVIAFGPDGSVYISVLAISLDCPSGVTVSRSTDGGKTFGRPVLAHYSASCDYSDDKNFLVIDNGRYSPHRGRLYQFWTPFLSDPAPDGSSLQVVRWSDNHGRTWSPTVDLTEHGIFTQDSQPMIKPDGTIVDTYQDFGAAASHEGPESRIGQDAATHAAPTAAPPPADKIVARTSHDGGATWSAPSTVTTSAGEGPAGIRCCLPSASADPVTGRLYTSWISPASDAVMLSQSFDGKHWSAAVQVTKPAAGRDYINTDVAAYRGEVFVANSTRNTTIEDGRFVQQQLSVSFDGTHFAAPIKLGRLSDLNYAAQAGGIFPGDYMGTAATRGRVYAVWARSSKPAKAGATYHQVVFGAALRS